MSIKKSSGLIGNRIRDLPVCSTVPQPTTLRRVPTLTLRKAKWRLHWCDNTLSYLSAGMSTLSLSLSVRKLSDVPHAKLNTHSYDIWGSHGCEFVFTLNYLTILAVGRLVALNGMMIIVVTEAPSQHFPGWTEENHNKTSISITFASAEIRTEHLLNIRVKCYP
jgi:hypothetical protein